ncbi:SH3 domain-binding protein 2-like isoform X2 [Mercenaria mercenaria]|uniref:SH3 domain-binding protein 2-like isoform X2 n=1 Tax=Mercenaria mercenaria TaxID=6596 RepID=UPI00234E7480|nr:SH3 domain-binding protein 2-like isoform X2 [Mercenaria mercenaria]
MSDGSSASQKILLEPLKNIGAQDILKVGSTYEGVLRKRGGRIGNLLHIGSAKWKQRFVVISQGCVYSFKDEYALRPQSAFSLSVYESVQETTIPNVLHVFEIKHEDRSRPSQLFASETEAKRKTWIAYIHDAITQVHQHSGGSQKLSADSDEGISMTPKKRMSRAPLPPLPPTPDDTKYKHKSKSEYSLESDDEEEYSEIKEEQEMRRLPRGATGGVQVMPTGTPKRQDTISRRPAIPLPETPDQRNQTSTLERKQAAKQGYEDVAKPEGKLPDYVNEETFKDEDFFFNDKNKEEAHRLLGVHPVGTFLVRLGNSTPTVLSVQTPLGIKEFQIAENDAGKVSINRSQYFPTLQNMLCFYNQNDLPKKEYKVKLVKGFKS